MVRQQAKKSGMVALEDQNGMSPVSNGDSIPESQSEIQTAYRNYTEAQKHLQYAFKEQDQQGKNAYKSRAKQYQFYEEIIEKAFAYRQMAEQQALEEYRDNLAKAQYIYREKIKQILVECKRTTDQAWIFAMETPQKSAGLSSRMNDITPEIKNRISSTIKWFTINLQQLYNAITRTLKDLKMAFSNNSSGTAMKPETPEIKNDNGQPGTN
jgi:hypothetical protein